MKEGFLFLLQSCRTMLVGHGDTCMGAPQADLWEPPNQILIFHSELTHKEKSKFQLEKKKVQFITENGGLWPFLALKTQLSVINRSFFP